MIHRIVHVSLIYAVEKFVCSQTSGHLLNQGKLGSFDPLGGYKR